MDLHARLTAYSWDIAGSLLGKVAFSLTSYGGVSPWIWVAACMVVWTAVFATRWNERVAYLVSGLCFLAFASAASSGNKAKRDMPWGSIWWEQ